MGHSGTGRKTRQSLDVTLRDVEGLRGTKAEITDAKEVIDYEILIKADDKPVLYYNPKLPQAFTASHSNFSTIELEPAHNKKELHFGMRPTNYAKGWVKGEFPANKKYEFTYGIVVALAEKLQEKIQFFCPEMPNKGLSKYSDSFSKTIGNTYFNHAILMENNDVPYHKDYPLFPELWSTLAFWSDNVEGGEIVIPPMNLAFKPTGYMIFSSATLMHGVVSHKKHPDGYRYSLLTYLDRNVLK